MTYFYITWLFLSGEEAALGSNPAARGRLCSGGHDGEVGAVSIPGGSARRIEGVSDVATKLAVL